MNFKALFPFFSTLLLERVSCRNITSLDPVIGVSFEILDYNLFPDDYFPVTTVTSYKC